MKAIRLIVVAATTLVVGLSAMHLLITGRPFPKWIVEELKNPQQVSEVTPAGLITSEGVLLKVNHVSELPTNSPVLRAAVERGVEVDDKGRTFGLLRIWHWCGNDPVRYHLARVNLSDLVLASGGKPEQSVKEHMLALIPRDRGLDYTEHGLSVSDLYRIPHISEMIERETELDGAANGSQPVRAETNRTSSAAGSRR